MIEEIGNPQRAGWWVGLHGLLGIASAFSPIPIIIWFYLVAILCVPLLLTDHKRVVTLLLLIVYLSSFELLCRLADTSPYIPYELGKYLTGLLLLTGIVAGARRGVLGWWMLGLAIPGFLIDQSGLVTANNLIFNGLGCLNVALAIVFFGSLRLSAGLLQQVLRVLLLAIFAALCCSIIKNPQLDEVEFELSSSAAIGGGLAANQVSTALGLGMFLAFLFLINHWKWTGSRWGDALAAALFAVQGLLTFSRGGMIGGALAILVVGGHRLFSSRGGLVQGAAARFYVIIGAVAVAAVFLYANSLTGGQLWLRYQGENSRTISGRDEKNLTIITSGRIDIFEGDLAIWAQHPVMGCGVGASPPLREGVANGLLAHVEASRLLAEHGLFGLAYLALLAVAGFRILIKKQDPATQMLLLTFYGLAIYTTFHAAMRTFVSPLLIGLSYVTILPSGKNSPP
ncbi:MAG: hypothetical protein MUC97_00430 [Bernardetiaceae bacterium]|jgi:hypothetical protein|nr:hypothetical protein [Bernardetiaceae bacterium]